MSPTPQNVLDNPNKQAIFMVWNINDHTNIKTVFKQLCALIINLNNSAAIRFTQGSESIVMGIGYEAWHILELGEPLPKELKSFEPIEGHKHTAVATRGDFHFHIRSDEFSFCIDTAAIITKYLSHTCQCVDEVHGFRYWDGRSILGFVDGTENPKGSKRMQFAFINNDISKYNGSSYLFVQKYKHNLDHWNNLSLSEQEKVMGRTKIHDIEMSDEQKPSNAHSSLANVGDDKKIIRDNMPFGNIASNEMGTYFIAYASNLTTVHEMLHRMFKGFPEGNYDRLLDFSTPVTGTQYFVPSIDLLEEWSE